MPKRHIELDYGSDEISEYEKWSWVVRMNRSICTSPRKPYDLDIIEERRYGYEVDPLDDWSLKFRCR